MGMVSSVLFFFDTESTYSCSSNKGDFAKLEERTPPRNIKGIEIGLEISGFGIVEYSVRSESGRKIALRYQEYYVTGLPNDLRIILPQSIHTSEDTRVTSYLIFMMSMMVMRSLILRRKIHIGRRPKRLRRFTSSMTHRTTFQLMNIKSPTR